MTTPIPTLPTPSAATLAMHERALAARRSERAAARELALALVDIADGPYAEMGYASVHEYAWDQLQIGASTCRQLRRVLKLRGVDAELVDQYLSWVRSESETADVDLGEAVVALIRKEMERVASAPRGEGDGRDPGDVPTSEPYRVFLTTCPCCQETTSPAADVDQTVADEAACDAEIVDEEGRNDTVIPRRVRRLVLARDGHRCSVPGCRLRLWLHLHHLRSRAFGGSHLPENLVTLCPLHHRRVHDGVLAIEVVGDRLVVIQADGTRRIGRWAGSRPKDAAA